MEELLDDKVTDPDFIPEDSTVITADPDAGKSTEAKGEGDAEAAKENAVQSERRPRGSGDRKKAINSEPLLVLSGFRNWSFITRGPGRKSITVGGGCFEIRGSTK